jgi:hypothetical protein
MPSWRARARVVQILLPDVDTDDFHFRERAGDEPRHRSGAATDVKDTMCARDRQMPQMTFDVGEPRLQLQSFAFLVAVDHVGQRLVGHCW